MKHLPNGDLLQDRALSMAKRFYAGVDQGIWEDLDEEDQMPFIETATRILIDSPERDMLQKILDYVSNPDMIEQWARFGRAGAPSLANSIRMSIEGEDSA